MIPVPRRCGALTLLLALVACGPAGSPEQVEAEAPAAADGGVAAAVVEASIDGLQAAIAAGRFSCVDVVQAYLDRIEAYDAPTGLNAISVVNPRALQRAAALDAALAAGEPMGPLFCAPLLVKDNFDTADLPTTAGSVALAGSLPPDDATMVRRVRDAGAIVLAKTNMAEWAFSPRQTISSTHGRTANAYDLDRVPAGSSGGTASGVAASFGVAGLGSDTGNSIRGPSARLALFGIRSTLGLTSRDGIIPLLLDRDVGGPMARSVADATRIFDVVAGIDPADPLTADSRGRREPSYLRRLRADGLRGARIGVLRALVPEDETDAQTLALFEAALEDLRAAGAVLVDPFVVPDLDALMDIDSCKRFRYDVAQYMDSLGDAAPFRDVATLLETGQFAPATESGLTYFADGPLDVLDCPGFLADPRRTALREAVAKRMGFEGVGSVVYPTWTAPPAAIDRGNEDYRGDNSQLIAPDAGMPAVTVPMGFTTEGWPTGLQFLGRRYDDGVLIQHAHAYEQATGHRRPPDGFPALTPTRPATP